MIIPYGVVDLQYYQLAFTWSKLVIESLEQKC